MLAKTAGGAAPQDVGYVVFGLALLTNLQTTVLGHTESSVGKVISAGMRSDGEGCGGTLDAPCWSPSRMSPVRSLLHPAASTPWLVQKALTGHFPPAGAARLWRRPGQQTPPPSWLQQEFLWSAFLARESSRVVSWLSSPNVPAVLDGSTLARQGPGSAYRRRTGVFLVPPVMLAVAVRRQGVSACLLVCLLAERGEPHGCRAGPLVSRVSQCASTGATVSTHPPARHLPSQQSSTPSHPSAAGVPCSRGILIA